MSSIVRTTIISLVIVLLLTASCDGKRKKNKKFGTPKTAQQKSKIAKELELRETNPPNFFRLVIMRMIYGIAAQMDLQERVAGWFNGAFVPPNADYDDYGLGGGIGDFGAGDLFDE